MRQLVFLTSAREDLIKILVHVTENSGRLGTARTVVASRRAPCQKLAILPGTLGRPRPELRHDIRSFPFRNHVIYFRLRDDVLEVVNILHSRRDVPGRVVLPDDG